MSQHLQYAVLAKKEYRQVIAMAIGHDIKIGYAEYGKVVLKKAIMDICLLNVQVLVIQPDVADEESLRVNLRQLRVKRPEVRVIVFAPGCKPGNRLVAALVSLGIYDLATPGYEEDTQSMVNQLIGVINQTPQAYSSIADWDITDQTKSKDASIASLPRQTVVVLNLTERAGSTIVATSLAGVAADLGILPTIVEMPTDPHYFHILGMALYEKLSREKLYSYPHEIIKRTDLEADRTIVFDNIAYVLTDPRQPRIHGWNHTQMMQLLLCCKRTGLVIVDGGGSLAHQASAEFAALADLIIIVIDPLPQQLSIANDRIEYLETLREKGSPIVYVVNRWDNSIPLQDFLTIAAIEPAVYFPMLDAAAIYQAGYACAIPYMVPSVKKAFKKPLDQLIKILFPKAIYQQMQRAKRERWFWRRAR